MLAKTYTATMVGLEAVKVEVEVDGNRGIPHFVLIGLPSRATDNAKERLTSALQNCGFRIKSKRTVVNLAPADLPKHGTGFDLAIAVGLLKMYGEITTTTDDTMFFGELGLDAQVKKIRGALPLVLAAKSRGFKKVIIPEANRAEVSLVSGIIIHPIRHLTNYLAFCQRGVPLPTVKKQKLSLADAPSSAWPLIIGQEHAKRALVVAAAGGHNLLLKGPPGVGKTLLARAMPTLLPPLTQSEMMELTLLYSACGLNQDGLVRKRPFRSPHHTISLGGLIGGGRYFLPGEISLAHRGVLFMDEFLEFPRNILEALRQPLEEGSISLTRASGKYVYPAQFTLVAATNPCPCGHRDSSAKQCRCSPHQLDLYRTRLSGPLLDRFDLQVSVNEVPPQDLATDSQDSASTSLEKLQELVQLARKHQHQRYASSAYLTNAEVPSTELHLFFKLHHQAQSFLTKANASLKLSARSYFKVIKVSRTIADLANSEEIQTEHVAEALQYRW